MRSINKSRRYEQAIEALVELKSEILADDSQPAPDSQLQILLGNLAPLPADSLFLGQAEDGLPVLLNLFDPTPGPLLIQADSGSGKTEFIRAVAASLELCHAARQVQYGVVSARPHEWDELPPSQHCIGAFDLRERACFDFILSLNTWAHSNRSDQSVILFWDGLEAVNQLDMEMVDNFRWMLLRGPAKKVWPIVTLNTAQAHGLNSWDGYFRTAISGPIADPDRALVRTQLTPSFEGPRPGNFTMQDGNAHMEIWMPRVSGGRNENLPGLASG